MGCVQLLTALVLVLLLDGAHAFVLGLEVGGGGRWRQQYQLQQQQRQQQQQRLWSTTTSSAMSTQPADLTPAVDKFLSLPPSSSPTLPYFMTAKGPTPSGPDPFALVAEELQPLSDYVKELVKSENPVLTMAASHFFDQVGFVGHWCGSLSAGLVCLGLHSETNSPHPTPPPPTSLRSLHSAKASASAQQSWP